MNKQTYLLPGLGFDHRIFSKLNLPEGNINYLDWQEPHQREHLTDYAFRVSGGLSETEQPKVLLGHSFGGVLAQEIAKVRQIDRVILLSSIRSRAELPGFFKVVGKLGLHAVFTKKSTFATFGFWAKKHGYDTEEKQQLFKNMVGQQSDHYLRWALRSLSNWQGLDGLETPVSQIHGDCDRTFPIQILAKPDHVVKGGSHMMVYDRGEEVSQLIQGEMR